ncbi:transketolase family protein [Eubacteriales bacterium KG127]
MGLLKIREDISNSDKIATRQAYGEVLVEVGAENPDLVVMDADLSSSTQTKNFAKTYPERFFNMGIAEQNLYGTAAGIAHTGKIVCASTFAMFATGRAYEIIRNSIAYPELNVKICATHSGITVGEDGASHQTFEDLALMRVIPDMTVICPSDATSTKELMRQAILKDGPVYVRLGRSGIPVVYDEYTGEKPVIDEDSKDKFSDVVDFEIGKAVLLRDGGDVTLVATGIMIAEALKAADELENRGISTRVIDMHTIKPIDEDILVKAAEETKLIVSCEEHSVIGGLGSAIAEVLIRCAPTQMRFVGQNDTFGESGKPEELLRKYGMTWEDICDEVYEYFDK